ncbi:MAG: hypothetical protein CL424_12775 [Acidimicrobiaceae bacterium]|nr:hypothetical protein [Acidimicrobiaceae bacterium]
MSTGRSIVSTCAAAVSIAGNPSDEFGGGAVAIPIPDLTAMAAVHEAEGGSFGHRPTDATPPGLADAIADAYSARFGSVPPVELSLSSNIPAGVGLAAGSALVIATLRSLAAFESRPVDPDELIAITSNVLGGSDETGRAVLLVQAIGKSTALALGPDGRESIPIPDDAPFFVAWSTSDSTEPIAATMRSLRRRFEGDHPEVVGAVEEWRVQAGRARRGLLAGDTRLVADAMHRTLATRLRVSEVSSTARRLIELGRTAGAAVNTPGGAGSIVGLARHGDHLELVRAAFADAGVDVVDAVDTA